MTLNEGTDPAIRFTNNATAAQAAAVHKGSVELLLDHEPEQSRTVNVCGKWFGDPRTIVQAVRVTSQGVVTLHGYYYDFDGAHQVSALSGRCAYVSPELADVLGRICDVRFADDVVVAGFTQFWTLVQARNSA